MKLSSIRNKVGTTLAGLTLLLGATAAYGVQKINGTYYDIEGNGVVGKQVSANQGGVQDSTLSTPAYVLFPTSDVEEPATPQTRHTTWGRIKAGYLPSRNAGLARPLEAMVSDGTLEFDGTNDYWSVTDSIGTLNAPLTYNIAVPPKVWTLNPYFQNISMEVPVIQWALFVGPGKYTDNLHWPSNAYPLPVDGTNFTQANQDTLAARSQHYVTMSGMPLPFHYAPGEVQRGINGVWWQFNDTGNYTEISYNPENYELYAVTIHTTSGGWINRKVGEHEMFRALGLRGPDFNDPRYGIAKTSPGPFNQYDASLVRYMIEKQKRNEEGKNNSTLIQAH